MAAVALTPLPPAALIGDSHGESSVPVFHVFKHKETGVIRKVHDIGREYVVAFKRSGLWIDRGWVPRPT